MSIPLSVYLIACAIASYTDIRWRRVPNVLTFAAMTVVVAATVPSGRGAVIAAFVALAVTIAAGSVVFGMGLLGGGDIKLLAVGAAAIGFPGFLLALLYVSCTGGVIAGVYALREGRLRTVTTHIALGALHGMSIVPAAGSRRIPYAVAIGTGSFIYIASESFASWFRFVH